jgi:hypothetical protein
MSTLTKLTRSLLVVGLLQAVSALADPSLLPEAHTQNGITYSSGGISEDEATAMKAAASAYNLMLTFAEKGTGEYLADVTVTIKDINGRTVLDTISKGPLFLIDLPAGRYTVQTEVNGQTQSKTTDITPRHHAELVYYWPQNVVDTTE